MDETNHRSARVRVALPIVVRGMSAENKYFEEQSETASVGKDEVITRLRNFIGLETEVHVTSVKSGVGGTFRVAWINTRNDNGFHSVGLELLDSEGELWPVGFPAARSEEAGVPSPVWLECFRCHDRLLTVVLEAEEEFLSEGFQISRHCDQCKATTAWELIFDEEPPILDPEGLGLPGRSSGAGAETKPREDHRTKGRAPIQMPIKVIRRKYGMPIEDISETQNVSRGGAYFLTNQNYDMGEQVEVILPFKEGQMGIPVNARVIRQDLIQGTFYKGVAIRLEGTKK